VRKWGTAALVVLALVGAATVRSTAYSAPAHNNPCHQARTCPSDDHSYLWSGMSCTSDPNQRLPADQTPVLWDGIQYWCHVVTDLGMGGGTTPSTGCESDRAAVRTLSDSSAARVDLRSTRTTVARLERLAVGRGSDTRSRLERRTYRVSVRLLGARLAVTEWEVTIGDLHSGATIVAGFPADTCTRAASAGLQARMSAARAAFVKACGLDRVAGFVRLAGRATLSGVAFVPSRAPSDAGRVHVELRPTLSFRAQSCSIRS
jgi:hypothetical protein